MPRSTGDPHQNAEDRHLGAVVGSLEAAEQAAGRGDYGAALRWVQVIESLGDELPMTYVIKRQTWRTALAENQRPA
jgi:hypothetical protein